MILRKITLVWTIVLFNEVRLCLPFDVPPTLVSHKITSAIKRSKKEISLIPTLTRISASAATPKTSYFSLQKDDETPSSRNTDVRSKLLDEAIRSNSTAASMLLHEINAVDNGIVEELLHLIDGSKVSNNEKDSGENLPRWTKFRILGRISRRARRASFRRVLDIADGTADGINNSDLSKRKEALVFILESISKSQLGGVNGLTGSEGIAIWNIERYAKRKWKEAANHGFEQPKPIATILEVPDEGVRQSVEEKYKAFSGISEHRIETIKTDAERGRKVAVQQIVTRIQSVNESQQQLEQEKERKAEAISTEQAKVLSIASENSQRALLKARFELDAKLKTESEKKKDLAEAAEIEKTRIQAEKQTKAEHARLQSITNERNQRDLLKFRLELEAKHRSVKDEKSSEFEAAEELERLMMVVENQRARLTATLEREAKAKAEQEANVIAVSIEEDLEYSKALSAELELKQRNLLETRFQIDAKTKEKKKKELEQKKQGQDEAERAIEAEAIDIAEEDRIQAEREAQVITAEKAEGDRIDEALKISEKDEARHRAIAKAREQPKTFEEEKVFADYYGAMEPDERAFAILYDLGMIEKSPDPKSPDYKIDPDDPASDLYQ